MTTGVFSPVPFSVFAQGKSDVRWLWDTYIPEGTVCLLSAFMKVGKSTLVYSLISSLVTGSKLLDLDCKKSKVLLLAVEGSDRDIRRNLLSAGVADDCADLFVHYGSLPLHSANYDALRKFVRENEIGLVIIDTLAPLIAVEDENDNSMVQKAVTPILAIAYEDKCTVLMVHHNNKGDGEGGKGIRGASSLFAMVDQALLLKYHGSHLGRQRRLDSMGRFSETPRELVVELNDRDEWEAVGSGKDASRKALQDLLGTLMANQASQPVSAMELARMSDRTLKQVHRALSPLPDFILRTGQGVKGDPFLYSYRIPAAVDTAKEPHGSPTVSVVCEDSTPAPECDPD